MSFLSDRVLKLGESQTLRMARIAGELKAQGKDVISLSLGEPDFNTPDFIKEAAKKAINENYSKYSPVSGFLELREAICKKLKRDNNLDYDPASIVVSTGAKQTIMNTVLALVNPLDEVVIPAPYWVSYVEMVGFAEGDVITIPTYVESDFKITPDELEKALTSKTKLFIFSNPCNPSGSMYSKKELEGLVEVFKKFPKVYIVSDEIYEYINFEEPLTSLASFSEIKNRVITVNGLSKGYAMTGWRLGYSASTPELASAMSKIQGQFTSGTSSISQRAAITALLEDPSSVTFMKESFLKRKNLVVEGLQKIPHLKVNDPHGAFYIFPDVSYYFGRNYKGEVIKDSSHLCELILTHALVATVAGNAFGSPKNIRLSYATSEEELSRAISRLYDFFTEVE